MRTLQDQGPATVQALLARHGMTLRIVREGEEIPGSYWGAPEAGLAGDTLYAQPRTPVHSILHEACHWICMDAERRRGLHTDAGGSDLEECGVCYLQVVLADTLPGYGRVQILADMDAWGYSFRLGGARRWFEEDAADARAWLDARGLLGPA